MTVDIFSVFSEITQKTSKNPIPSLAKNRIEELRKENIDKLRNQANNKASVTVQTHYDTPANHAFPNSRTGEEKDTVIAERKAAANPYSQARHPSPLLFFPKRN